MSLILQISPICLCIRAWPLTPLGGITTILFTIHYYINHHLHRQVQPSLYSTTVQQPCTTVLPLLTPTPTSRCQLMTTAAVIISLVSKPICANHHQQPHPSLLFFFLDRTHKHINLRRSNHCLAFASRHYLVVASSTTNLGLLAQSYHHLIAINNNKPNTFKYDGILAFIMGFLRTRWWWLQWPSVRRMAGHGYNVAQRKLVAQTSTVAHAKVDGVCWGRWRVRWLAAWGLF